MKYTALCITAFFLSHLTPAPAIAQTNRAIEISIFGIGPAVDSEAVRSVQRVIGKAVARGIVDNYITYGYGIEGGSSSCIELSPNQDDRSLLQLERELLQIQPNPATTSYNVKTVAACNKKVKSLVQASEQLADTQWLLEDLGGTSAIANPPQPTLRFVSTNRIEGQGGCNQYSANSQFDGEQITISNLVSTKRACVDSQVQTQEDQYFRALSSAQRVSLDGTYLLIYSEGFDKPLKFSQLPLSN